MLISHILPGKSTQRVQGYSFRELFTLSLPLTRFFFKDTLPLSSWDVAEILSSPNFDRERELFLIVLTYHFTSSKKLVPSCLCGKNIYSPLISHAIIPPERDYPCSRNLSKPSGVTPINAR